jgi:hypothetical protein
MPVSATTLKRLLEAGLEGDILLEVVAHIDADHESYFHNGRQVDIAADKRRAWDRERKAVQRAGNVSGGHSTGHSTGTKVPNDASVPLLTSCSNLTSKEPPYPQKQDFEGAFWPAYPHKVGKGAAERAFERVRKSGKVSLAELLSGLQRYIADKPADRDWCNPATWLNQRRWEDSPAAASAPSATVTPLHGQSTKAGFYAMRETPQFVAWDEHLRSIGKRAAVDKAGGWWFKAEWPPLATPLPRQERSAT